MIDAWTREGLRQRAVGAWSEAKRLHHETARLIAESDDAVQLSTEARGRRSSNVHRFAAGNVRPVWAGHFSFSITARELECLADRAIRRCNPTREDRDAANGGAGLVASAHPSTLDRLEALVGSRTGFLATARDAGTALGLVITAQPDLAVVDTRLDVANGADLVLTVPVYAPRTRTLLLTDDDEMAEAVRVAGVDVLSCAFSDEDVSSWISTSAA